VTCRHVVEDTVHTFQVRHVKIFAGTHKQAFEAALLDRNQYRVRSIHDYRGDPDTRTTMEFFTEWEDGTKLWKVWCNDIITTVAFDDLCKARKELQYLLIPVSKVAQSKRELNKLLILIVEPEVEVYVNLRQWGHSWFESLALPDWEHKQYVIPFRYTRWTHKESHALHRKRIDAYCPLLDEHWTARDHVWVSTWGSNRHCDPTNTFLVTTQFVHDHPNLRQQHLRAALSNAVMLNSMKQRSPYLNVVTWNVNSLRKRYDMVLAFIQIEKPNIFFIQETKMEDPEFDKLFFPSQYFRVHTGMKQFNGVAILSTIVPTNHITVLPNCPQSSCRFVQITIANLVFINVYIHQGQRIGSTYYNDKLAYLKSLIQHVQALKDRSYTVILGGDMNIMPTEDDLYNPLHPEWEIMAMVSIPERNLFQSILNIGFHDIVAERL
jgi:exodeoxyribonuclease III